MSKAMLFSPGPVVVSDRVRNALMHYDICHRGQEFMDLFVDTQEKVKKLYKAGDDSYSLVISGSGTATNECVLSSVFKKDESALLISNGVFGERLEEIITKYNVNYYKADFAWGEFPNLEVVEALLKAHPDIKVIAMVYHETSTGMINPAKGIGTLAEKYGKIFFVDAISASAGEDIDMVDQKIDIITGVGGKCLGAFPGAAYICAKESILKSIEPSQCKNVYLNLYKHYDTAVKSHQTPNTPNVTLIYALNEALSEYIEVGNKVERYRTCSQLLRKGLKDLGLKFLLEEKYMSNTVTSVFLPAGKNAVDFSDALEENGYVVYLGKGKYLDQNMIQVANMGEIYPEDCEKFLSVFAELLK